MAANKLKKVSKIIFNILLSSHLILICFIKDFKANYFKKIFKNLKNYYRKNAFDNCSIK